MGMHKIIRWMDDDDINWRMYSHRNEITSHSLLVNYWTHALGVVLLLLHAFSSEIYCNSHMNWHRTYLFAQSRPRAVMMTVLHWYSNSNMLPECVQQGVNVGRPCAALWHLITSARMPKPEKVFGIFSERNVFTCQRALLWHVLQLPIVTFFLPVRTHCGGRAEDRSIWVKCDNIRSPHLIFWPNGKIKNPMWNAESAKEQNRFAVSSLSQSIQRRTRNRVIEFTAPYLVVDVR